MSYCFKVINYKGYQELAEELSRLNKYHNENESTALTRYDLVQVLELIEEAETLKAICLMTKTEAF